MYKKRGVYVCLQFVYCLGVWNVHFGCASSKKVVYLQDIKVDKRVKAACEYRTVIHVDDLLSIIVSCDDIEAALPFNTPDDRFRKEVTSGTSKHFGIPS